VSSAEAVDTAARYGGRYEDIPRRIPDSTKAQRELGWRLQVDVEEGIRRTIDWARANPWYLKEPTDRSLSERAVGERPHCRCQLPAVFDRQVVPVRVDKGIADDDGAAVCGAKQLGEVGVLSAAGFGGDVSEAMPGWLTAVDRGGEQALTSSRWPDRHSGTDVCGSGIGPSTSTLAPVSRSCCTRWVKLSIHAGSYGA